MVFDTYTKRHVELHKIVGRVCRVEGGALTFSSQWLKLIPLCLAGIGVGILSLGVVSEKAYAAKNEGCPDEMVVTHAEREKVELDTK